MVIERDLYKCKYAYAVASGDVESALAALVNMQNLSNVAFDPGDVLKRAPAESFEVTQIDTSEPQLRQLLTLGVLDLIANQVVRGTYNHAFLRKLAAGAQASFGRSEFADGVIEAATQLYGVESSQTREGMLAYGMTVSLQRVRYDVSARLLRDLTLLAHIEFSLLKDELLPLATSLIVSGWRQVGEEIGEEFQVEVAAALERGGHSMERQAAEVLLLARDWVNHPFADAWFEILDRLGTEGYGATGHRRSA